MGSYAAMQQPYAGHQTSRYPPLQQQPQQHTPFHQQQQHPQLHHHHAGSHTSREPAGNSPYFGSNVSFAQQSHETDPTGHSLSRMASHAPGGYGAQDRMGHYGDPMTSLARKQSMGTSAFGTSKIARQSTSRFAEGAKASPMINHQARWN